VDKKLELLVYTAIGVMSAPMTVVEAFQRGIRRARLRVTIRSFLRRTVLQIQGARIGKGTRIPRITVTWPHQIAIGSNCILEDDIFFKFDGPWKPGPSIMIGDGTFLGRACEFNIRKQIDIGGRCLIASGCKFIDHDHGIPDVTGLIGPVDGPEVPIKVGENAWIGANAILLKGVTIGRGAIVGAGSVVNRPVPSFEIWAGVPARRIGHRQQRNCRSEPRLER
jgi:acetyltransferase-like isoleucine patch superfamily enzyme